MNPSVPTAPRASWRQRLAKGAVLSAAIAVGFAAAQLLPSTSAFAAGAVASMHGGEPSAEMRERHQAMMHDHVQRVLTDAGVSAAQQQKIEGLVHQAMDDQHGDMERMHADMKLLKDLLTAPTIDTAKVATVRAEQEQIALQTTRRLTDTALAIAQQLTPAQRQALGKQIDAMFEGHHGPHGPGAMFGHGPEDGPRGEGPDRE
jgi:Spy/CpxP family protein refolding chaperone